eukprot:snap_masked-scaffold_9-processed-gene-11.41-mRNA-1 protein AED:1.00 eAED:1.00 QI:0/0/0/0/1/1/2/0/135
MTFLAFSLYNQFILFTVEDLCEGIFVMQTAKTWFSDTKTFKYLGVRLELCATGGKDSKPFPRYREAENVQYRLKEILKDIRISRKIKTSFHLCFAERFKSAASSGTSKIRIKGNTCTNYPEVVNILSQFSIQLIL